MNCAIAVSDTRGLGEKACRLYLRTFEAMRELADRAVVLCGKTIKKDEFAVSGISPSVAL